MPIRESAAGVKLSETWYYMATTDLSPKQADPLQVVADIASKKIDEAIALLNEYQKCGDEPVPAAPDAMPKSPAARPKRSGK
jgi:hypothetical protein